MFSQARKNSPAGKGTRSLRVHRYGNPCLRRRARQVQAGTSEVKDCLEDLWAILQASPGVALAAPQVGRNLALVVIQDPREQEVGRRLDLVNPRIQKFFGQAVDFEEGCLSFPGLYTMIRRSAGVIVEYEDSRGTTCSLRDDGLLARIVQHEVDHLQGILFTDHLLAWKRSLLVPRLLWFAGTEAILRLGQNG